MDPITILCAVLVVGAIAIYRYTRRHHDFFKKNGIPYLKPLPIIGNMGPMVFKRKAMADILLDAYNQNSEARYVGMFDFETRIVMIRDPELVKTIGIKQFDHFPNHRTFGDAMIDPLFGKSLFSLHDDRWREMRALLSPSFTSSKMKMMYKIVSECAVNLRKHITEDVPPTKDVDAKMLFSMYTLDVIATTAFGISINSLADPKNEFAVMGQAVSKPSMWRMIVFFLARSVPLIGKLIPMRMVEKKHADFFTSIIANTVAKREAEGIARPDMIHLMMQARDKAEKGKLDIDDITAQAFIFFLGGFESPSATLAFAALELALNKDVQRKLQEEIDRVLEKCEGDATYEAVHNMKYLDAVVNEVLRLYPPVPMLDRGTLDSWELPPSLPGLKPLRIDRDVTVWFPAYCLQRDPKYFPNPDKFDPERFSEENLPNIVPFTYLPFGVGPRICIANRFALMEVKLALFHVLSKCNFLVSPKAVVPIQMAPESFNTAPKGGFWVRIEKRQP